MVPLFFIGPLLDVLLKVLCIPSLGVSEVNLTVRGNAVAFVKGKESYMPPTEREAVSPRCHFTLAKKPWSVTGHVGTGTHICALVPRPSVQLQTKASWPGVGRPELQTLPP